jgi:thioredoxin-like negative regulator of GroEL
MAKGPRVTKYDKHNTKKFDQDIMKISGIVLFHHPQCIHCVMLRPKWEMMKKKLRVDGDIMEVDVSALEESNHPIRNQIQGYPMIVRVENGKIKEHFKEERNIDNMLKFIQHHFNHTNHKLDYNYKITRNKMGRNRLHKVIKDKSKRKRSPSPHKSPKQRKTRKT